MQNNTLKLQQSINEIITSQDAINYTINNIFLEQTLSEHFSIFNLILAEFNLETNDLILAIATTRLGQLHPNFMSFNTLINQFKSIEQEFPENRQLPISTKNIANVLDFISLVSLSINFVNDHLIYVLEIPICGKDDNVLFSIKSIPMIILDNQFAYIRPVNDFVPMQLRKCNNNKIQTICQHPGTFLRKRTMTCKELIYLNLNKIPESCDIRHVSIRPHYLKN